MSSPETKRRPGRQPGFSPPSKKEGAKVVAHRLSAEALTDLDRLSANLNLNKTAVLELALRDMASGLGLVD